ncbi:Fringe glycosyltransferase [Bienertia sinuspersici]
MARLGVSLRRRKEFKFLQFIILMINIIIMVYLIKMDEGSSSGGRGRNKRFWTAEEDKALINALHELSTDPHWKCENGFRNGYMNRLEDLIGKAIPDCGLKSSPHIDSRLKTLLGKFRAITQILATSGFKWDDERNMISMDRFVYDEYCKVILLSCCWYLGKPKKGEDVQVDVDSSDNEDAESAPPLKKVKTEKKCKNKEPQKVATKSTNSELACLQDFMKDMNSHLSTMASVWSRADDHEQHMADKSSQVLNDLLQLQDISFNKAFEVANILTAQPNKLVSFSIAQLL